MKQQNNFVQELAALSGVNPPNSASSEARQEEALAGFFYLRKKLEEAIEGDIDCLYEPLCPEEIEALSDRIARRLFEMFGVNIEEEEVSRG